MKNPISKIVNNHYFDIHGVEVKEGDTIRLNNGRERKVYRTTEEELGIDATNPAWIELGMAWPCEYGVYPFTPEDMLVLEKV